MDPLFWAEDSPASQVSEALTKEGNVTAAAPAVVNGDWVLFHPVYTPQELQAVEVGISDPLHYAPA